MGGCRCSYKNCTNTTKTRENLHFFHYPVKQKERCRQWIENANKPQFYDLDEDQLRNKVICQTHFEDYYFPNIQKKRLLQDAIPTLEGDCKQDETPTQSSSTEEMKILPASDDGTLFVLETNMPNQYQSEKVESYIYTKSGLVLPIKRDAHYKNVYSSNDQVFKKFDIPVSEPPRTTNSEQLVQSNLLNYNSSDNETQENDFQMLVTNETSSRTSSSQTQKSDDADSNLSSKKYAKIIKQHSKDIALIKRILRKRTTRQKPSIRYILNCLSSKIPPSLLNILNVHLDQPLQVDDLQFFNDFYGKSPDLFRLLTQKYHWRLPSPSDIKNSTKRNGHLNTNE